MKFEWDPPKDRSNRAKHGLGFAEASELLSSGVDYLEIFDRAHESEEDRFIAIGPIRRGVIVVVYAERQEGVLRIISARMATRSEARLFRQWRGGGS